MWGYNTRSKRRREGNFVGKDIRRTMLKVHILWRASSGNANAYSLIKEFGDDELISGFYADRRELKDDIYNVTRGLEKAGLLASRRKIQGGRLKQYFGLTKDGKRVLESSVEEFLKSAKGISTLFRR